MASDEKQLELIRESLYNPEAEEEAKRLFLAEVYQQVRSAWRPRAPNGGLLAELPGCVKRGVCGDDLRFTYNALRVLAARYMTRDETGRWMETPSMVMKRVAEGLARVAGVDPERLYRVLVEGRFVFNSPTLFNMYVDGARGTLSACYVTPVYDSMDGIMDAARVQALTFKWGGGQGFSFSELRPRYDVVRGTSGVASGPLSFMRLFDMVTEVVKQGGKRRGANMGILHAWHPDVYNPGFDPWAALYNTLPPQVRDILRATKRLIEELEAEGYTVDPEYKRWVAWLVEAGEKKPWITVEEAGFVQAKEPPLQDTNLTNFNISVAANDAFMEAVLRDQDWWMVNPRFSEESGVYRLHYTVSLPRHIAGDDSIRYQREYIEKGAIPPYMYGGGPAVLAVEKLGRNNPYLNIFEEVLEEAKKRALAELEKWARAQGREPSVDEKNPYVWRMRARELFEKIVENAWAGGDPGIIYIDNHNRWITTPWLGLVNASNPCSEQLLYPFESCNLGSVNLEKFVVCDEKGCRFDLESFCETVRLAVRALDAVIDANQHPDPRQDKVNKFTRKIGLGFMGLAAALARLGIPYDSDEAVAFTLIVSAAMEACAWMESWRLGLEKGPAPAFKCKRFDWKRLECLEEWSDPREALQWFTPALVKAQLVSTSDMVCYHRGARLDDYIMARIAGEARRRVEDGRRLEEGCVELLKPRYVDGRPRRVIDIVWESVFGGSSRTIDDWMKYMEQDEFGEWVFGEDLGWLERDVKALVALAVDRPLTLWNLMLDYWLERGAVAPRNTVTTTVAPTGTISIIAGTSSGIEPFFALVFKRVVTVGEFLEVVRPFRDQLLRLARETGATRDHLRIVYEEVAANHGSLRRALKGRLVERLREAGAPPEFIEGLGRLARIFPTSIDLDVWWHIAHQAAAQLYVDQAISKTINLPREAPVEAAYTAFLLGWLTGLKGVTVYREGSKATSVIQTLDPAGTGNGRILRRRVNRRFARMQLPKKREILAGEVRDEVVVDMFTGSECKTCEM